MKHLLIVSLLVAKCSFAFCNCEILLTHYEILEDASTEKTFFEVFNSNYFEPTDDKINFGYTKSAYWIKIPLHSGCKSKEQFLVSNFRALDYIDFFLVKNGILVDSLKTGFLRPVSTRQKLISRFVFQLPDVISENTLAFVRIQKKEGTLRTDLSIKDEITLYENHHNDRQVLFFFLGVSFLMLIFAGAYFLLYKMKMFLWYALFVISSVMHQIGNMGFGNLYIWGDWTWFSNISRVMFTVPSVLGVLMFSYSLLKVHEFCPPAANKFFNVLKYLLIIQLVFPFLPLPEYPYRFALYMFHLSVTTMAFVYFLYISWKAIQNKHLPGYLFISGVLTMLLIILFAWLLNLGVIRIDLLPEYFHVYVSITMMSFAMFSLLSYTLDSNKKHHSI